MKQSERKKLVGRLIKDMKPTPAPAPVQSPQDYVEKVANDLIKKFDSATAISITIIGLLPDQFDAVDAPILTTSKGVDFKSKMVERVFVSYHKREDRE